MGEGQHAVPNITRAYELRNQVSEPEYYYITFFYHRTVTRNLEICRQTLESWMQRYPTDINVHGLLSAFTAVGTGHFDRAVEEAQKTIELDPDFAIGYESLARAYLYVNRLPEAEGVLQKAYECHRRPLAKRPGLLQDARKGDCSGGDRGFRLKAKAEISVITSPIGKG
jgi:eukaryotic-like serine/threonine-protein kinase